MVVARQLRSVGLLQQSIPFGIAILYLMVHFSMFSLINLLNPGVHPRASHPEVTGIPQVDSSTSQRQWISMHAEVTYLINPPITTKPVVRTN